MRIIVQCLVLLCCLAGVARGQEPGKDLPKPAAPPRLRFDPSSYPDSVSNNFTFTEREMAGYFSGSVVWTYEIQGTQAHLYADRVMILAKSPRKEHGSGGEPRENDAKGLDLREWTDWTLYAENVRLELPARHTSIEAESLLYDRSTGRAVARGVRLHTIVGFAKAVPTIATAKNWWRGLEALDHAAEDDEGVARTPLSIHARVLRMTDFEEFDGEDIEFSTCEFGVPHMAFHSERVTVTPTENEESRKTSGAPVGVNPRGAPTPDSSQPALAQRDFLIDPEHTWLELEGHSILPMPLAYWNTRWDAQLPIRHFDFGHSGQFGYFGEVNWNVNYFLNLLPTTRFLPVKIEDSKLGLETDYFQKRGVGIGPNAEYGRNPERWDPWQLQLHQWQYYGEAEYYFINDRGKKDRSTRQDVPRENRYWGHAWHRQSVPYLGLFDLEYSKISDSAFLSEYFERISKEEKEQETLIYWRRNIRDNLALTGLYSQRINDFQTQVERAPEGKILLMEQPIFETGLYTDLNLQAAYLHRLENDALGAAPRGFSRADIFNEWAYPVHWTPYLEARPFALLRYTDYREVLDASESSEDRASFGAGVAVSQHWSRIYQFTPDSFAAWLLGVPRLKHVISPKVTYLNLFANDLDPEDTIPVDAVDTVDLEESIAFSLRNEIFVRSLLAKKRPPRVRPYLQDREGELETLPHESRRLLDSEVSFALFPRAQRDNGGDRSSLLILDNTASLIPNVEARAWFELDPNRDFRGERVDASLTYDIVPKTLSVTVGDRFTRKRSNLGYTFLNWAVSDKWVVDAYYSRDFEARRDVEYNFSLSRIFHRMALNLEYSQDVGEDRNTTVYVNIMPVEMLRVSRHGHRR